MKLWNCVGFAVLKYCLSKFSKEYDLGDTNSYVLFLSLNGYLLSCQEIVYIPGECLKHY